MHQRSRRFPPALLRPLALFALFSAATLPLLASSSLTPTRAALLRQSISAREAGLTYLDNDAQVHELVRTGQLVTLRGNDDYFIHPDVRHAAARAEVKLFVERLAHQYRAACGDRLVVTSLVRPRNRQPWNSDPLSVHPTGMAVDLRIPQVSACRRWLETTLLALEDNGAIEAARERVVPHYHIVVFPAYEQQLEEGGVEIPAPAGTLLASLAAPAPTGLPAPALPLSVESAIPLEPVAAAVAIAPAPVSHAPTAPAVTTVQSTPRGASVHRSVTGKRTATYRPAKRPATRRYKVRRGDTLWTIARHHGVTVAAIRSMNRVPSRLKPGQLLAIPAR